MKVRIPQQPSQREMMEKLQRLQSDMQSKQEELDAKEYDVSSGGGAVTIKITGTKEIKSVKIDPSVVDPDDIEMLEDMIAAAVNEATKQSSCFTRAIKSRSGSLCCFRRAARR